MSLTAKAALLAMVIGLSACSSLSEKGQGLNHLDTISAEDKAQDAWFNSFYGSSHCVWGAGCKADEEEKTGGGGGFWGGGAGPSDSAPSGNSSDSGSN